MSERFDPGGRRLPIKLDATSNGEFLPRPVAAGVRYANRLARENAIGTAKKLGLGRRAFLKSICGAAATLLSMNEAFARCGKTGGFYALPREAAFEPAAARERIRKLFRYVGENNVLWGTDSIWYGSPQDQIRAFRAFQIAPENRERYGYPEITPTLRAKVFGLNAAVPYGLDPQALPPARDRLAEIKQAYAEDPEPSFATWGPRDADEFLALHALSQGKV